jgi:hypothetical protein
MEIRIGVTYTPKELVIELAEGKDGEKAGAEAVSAIETAVKDAGIAWLTDVKGRRVGVPSDKLAYVEIFTDDEKKRVGFGR